MSGVQERVGPTTDAKVGSAAPVAKTAGAVKDYGDPRCGLYGAAVMLTAGMLAWSFLSVYLWSSMFVGVGNSSHPYAVVRENYWLSNVLLGAGFLLGITLYLLDVFMPPHLPGQYGALWDKDRYVGRALLVLVVLLILGGVFFMAAYYPHFPMLMFIAVEMGIPASIRWLTTRRKTGGGASRGAQGFQKSNSKRLIDLKMLVRKSDEALGFYKALALACFLSSMAVTLAWIVLVGSGQICFSDCDNQFTSIREGCDDASDGANDSDSGLVVFLAMSPLFIAFANLVFGLFAVVRVVMNSAYLSTSRHRNELASALQLNPEVLERIEVLDQVQEVKAGCDSEGVERGISEEFEIMETRGTQQLMMLVKAVGFGFIVLIGFGYAGALLIWADNAIASMFVSLLVVFFIGFILMTVGSFTRIAHVLGNWLIDLPLWGKILGFMRNDWVQAFIICLTLPLVLPFAILCIANQRVRSLRGISGFVDQDAVNIGVSSTIDPVDPAAPPTDINNMRALLKELRHLLHPSDTQEASPLRFWITARVHGVWQKVRRLRWLSLYTKVYTWCLLPCAYYVGALVFNAGFAYLRYLLTPVPFGLVIFLTFVVGVCAFLWPTVPGMVVYMFGGLLIPDTCTLPSSGDKETQFWVGVCINIVLGFFLKLTACAIQQQVIGAHLGHNIKVRSLCRVHTAEMRAVESVLRKPGLSLGKVAILCGGPDWPTSVLCGIMGLSLLSCEIGTTPIFFYIIPCSLCGSAYLRANDSAEWAAAASAMILATTIITGMLWVIMAWAVQKEWEQKGEELAKPLRKHGDLWFLDHRADTLAERCAVRWNDLPRVMRNCFAAGAFIQILASHGFFWGYYYLFGDFTVSEAWANIAWYADTIDTCGCYTPRGTVERGYCVFAAGGIAVTVIYLIAWLPYKVLYRYWGQRNAKIEEELDQEFDEDYQRRFAIAFFEVGHLGKDVEVAMAAAVLRARAGQQLRGAGRAGLLLPAVTAALEQSRGPRPEPEPPSEPEAEAEVPVLAEAEGGEGDRGPVAASAGVFRLPWASPERGAMRSLEKMKQLRQQGLGMFPMTYWCSVCSASNYTEAGEVASSSPRGEGDVGQNVPV